MRVRVTGGWLVRNNVILAIANKVKDKFKQLWTTNQVPDGEKVKHDFKDGKGEVDAVPYDEIGLSTEVIKAAKRAAMAYGQDSVGLTTKVSDAKLELGVAFGSDQVSITNTVIDTFRTPKPVILTTINDVPDRIAEVVPAKTEAMPDGAFKFLIKYVEGYSYVEGDIWVSAGTLSDDGNYLTVSSPENLEITLILAPDPQEWLLEAPSESAIQEATDRQLPDIPRDGHISRSTINKIVSSDYFFFINVLNNAVTFVTNLSNNTFYNTMSGKYNFGLTFGAGYDYNDIKVYLFNYDDDDFDAANWIKQTTSVFIDEKCNVIAEWNDTHNTLMLSNITNDIKMLFEIGDAYKNPKIVSDEVILLRDISKIQMYNYFVIVNLVNNAGDYLIPNVTYATPLCGNSTSFNLTYNTGYDNTDVVIVASDDSLVISNEMVSATVSKLVVSNFSDDVILTINKYDGYNNYLSLAEECVIERLPSIKKVDVIDYFYYVLINNLVPNLVTFDAAYKTASPKSTIKFKCTFSSGYDYRNIDVDYGKFETESNVTYLVFDNLIDDIKVQINEKPPYIYQSTDYAEGQSETVELNKNINKIEYTNYFYVGNVINTSEHIVLNGIPYNCITQLNGSTSRIVPTYEEGYNSSDFIVSYGVLTNNEWSIPPLPTDMKLYITDDDFHDPKSDGSDDLNIFSGTDRHTRGQYRIIQGDGTIVSSYAVINDQPGRMENLSVFAFNNDEIDLVNWDTNVAPGNVHTYWVSNDSNVLNEVISIQEVDGKMLYRHDIELKTQFTMVNTRQYMFKVRGSNQPDNTIIAYAKDTGSENLICSNDEHFLDGIRYYMQWNDTSYVVNAAKITYLEINNIKM